MKKIYLLTALVACIATTRAQDCPTPRPAAINYPNNGNTPPYCKVVYTGGFYPAQLSIRHGASLIPEWGTSNTVYIPVQPDGSANFVYDCNTYGNALYATIEQVVNGQKVKVCEVPVIQQASLPIKLTSFNGRLQTDNSVTLDWSSAIEWDSYQYQVQRSVDGKNYETVGMLKAAGNSNETVRYNFVDQLPAAGAYFYRLNQVDFDGKAELSKVVYVNSKKGAGIVTKVFPNPFNSEIQLIGATSANMTPGKIHVYTLSGQSVNFRIVGANAIAIDPSVPTGIYLLQVKNDNDVQTFKVQKLNQ